MMMVPPENTEEVATTPYYILLSARKERVLRTMIEELQVFVEREGEVIPDLLARMAYTLQTGREQMPVRCVIEASSIEELSHKLFELANRGPEVPVGTNTRKIDETEGLHEDALIERWIRDRALEPLSRAWLEGVEVNWQSIYGTDHPIRVNLPTYPFDNQRYWITESRGQKNIIASHQRAEGGGNMQAASQASSSVRSEPELPHGRASTHSQAVAADHDALAQTPSMEPAHAETTVMKKSDTSRMTDQKHAQAHIPSLRDLQVEISEGLASALYMDVDDIDLDETFFELGVESVSGVEWIKSLNDQYSLNLKVSAIYDTPTLRTFSAFIHEQISARSADGPPINQAVGEGQARKIFQTNEIANNAGSQEKVGGGTRKFGDVGFLERQILDAAATILMVDVNNLSPTTPLKNIGIVGDVFSKFIHDLAKSMGVGNITSTLTADQTPAQLSLLLHDCLAVASGEAAYATPRPVHNAPPETGSGEQPSASVAAARGPVSAKQHSHDDAVAIIGMAGQFPMASNAEEFWTNLVNGRDCITQIPYQRWGGEGDKQSFGYPHTGVLEGADQFDPLFFSISPKEARLMEPQQRVFLQNCWSCIEDAGYAPSSLGGSRCGVFAGCSGAGYGVGRIDEASTHALMGHTTSILPARISYHLDLKGPCMSVDTACSSSLVAISQACTSLVFGGCDLALAGGVSVFASPIFSMMAAEGGMLSKDGRCFTFDNRANGFVPSEGVGVFLLKRLRDAEADGDRIHGVVRGWGINHDGKTNGMTAPSVVSQTELECEIYDRFGIDPENISYVEAHGTGTSLGDPIEVQGLTDAFKRYTENRNYCALGSVKSNIGHALAAAGAAGVMKVLLSLKHETLPPTINYTQLNDEIDLDESAFFINDRARPWTPAEDGIRRAAVSSFSYNGTNAHLVVEEYPPNAELSAPVHATKEKELFVLSARNDKQLRRQAKNLAEFLAEALNNTREMTSDIAYTLQVGRDAMNERLGFVAGSTSDALDILREFLAEDESGRYTYGNVRKSKRNLDRESDQDSLRRKGTVESALVDGDLNQLLSLWMEGTEIDWSKLRRRQMVTRTSLPTYPFEPTRYWLDNKGLSSGADVLAAPQELKGEPVMGDAGEMTQRFERLLEQAVTQ